MKIHSETSRKKCDSDLYVASCLVDTYVKCGSMLDARRIFDRMTQRNVVSWNSLILGYAENGEEEVALELFGRMNSEVFKPDAQTYVAALSACTRLATKEVPRDAEDGFQIWANFVDLEKGMAVHARAATDGFDSNVYVASSLIDMYSKYGVPDEARKVFDELHPPRNNVVTWNVMIQGYVENGEAELAIELFTLMLLEGTCSPNARTFVAAFKRALELVKFVELGDDADRSSILSGLNLCACLGSRGEVDAKMVCLERGMAFHIQAYHAGWNDYEVARGLVAMYAKCGSMGDARRVFDTMPRDDVAAWSSMVLGYAENKQAALGLELFREIPPRVLDAHSLAAALKASGSLASLGRGKATHALACRLGMEESLIVGTSLVDFYGKCGSMVDARLVFDKIFAKELAAWTALVEGYGRQGSSKLVMELLCGIFMAGETPYLILK
ncbi:pentatricopeptide repeat-containing protein At1g11290, chloroplastic-like [Selaginella moellendorffii]|uniref:pentatricopeptide repeat-containing protein At1g11290, chloroplastic-like n=1 Tax=Selaginella moellendorffii TaxID=88036 RepID=UPI000D1D03F7|nr:pentatricopeptide repeat-containing protein At1g11290, chloroplastic-like [Selaginella moellendorffii]|eukprot:XP_024541282.1 pentatricopeptide repeat-containing protein At1g11290, chloroplastic-like [Selaginella moellendorffii]